MRDAKRAAGPLTLRMVDAFRARSRHSSLDTERFGPLLDECRQRLEARRATGAGSLPTRHTDFTAAFEDGQAFVSTQGKFLEATVREVGQLVVTSGRIVACESFYESRWRRPLARTIPTGRYPVVLSSAGGRIACAMLRITEARPARWEIATWPGQDPSKVGVGEFIGFSVDGGTGAFLDADQIQHLDEGFAWPPLDYRVTTRRKDPIHGRWNTATCDEATGGNLFFFESGYGDGGYASYWGLDDDGDPTCLVTDFRVLTELRDAAFSLPIALRRPPGDVRHRALDIAGLIMEVIPGPTPGRSLIVGILGPGASRVSVILQTEAGDRLAAGTSPNVVERDCLTFSVFELVVPNGQNPAWADLCVRLPLGSLPMQAIGR